MLQAEEFLKLLVDYGLTMKDVSDDLANDDESWKKLDHETLHRTLRVASVNKMLLKKKGCEPLKWPDAAAKKSKKMKPPNAANMIKETEEIENEEEEEEEKDDNNDEDEEEGEDDDEEFLKMKAESTGGGGAGLERKQWRSIKGIYGTILGVALNKKVFLTLYQQCGCADALKLRGDKQKCQEYLEAELKKIAIAKINKTTKKKGKKKKKNNNETEGVVLGDLDKKARAIVREAAKKCRASI